MKVRKVQQLTISVVASLYQTNPTKVTLNEMIGNSQVNLDKFTFAIEAVNGLINGFGYWPG